MPVGIEKRLHRIRGTSEGTKDVRLAAFLGGQGLTGAIKPVAPPVVFQPPRKRLIER